MIKDKLKTITDDEAREVALLLLKERYTTHTYEFDKISRQAYDVQHGCDAEESVDIFFNAKVIDEAHEQGGWKNKRVWIKLVESDRYHDFPYFAAFEKDEGKDSYSFSFLSNHIEATEYLQKKGYL